MRPFSRNLPERSVLSLLQTSLLLDHWSEKRESFQEVLNSSWADQAVWGSLVSKPLALAYSIGLPSRRWYSSRTTLMDPIFELDNDTQPPLRLQITEWCCPLTRANATVDCCVFTLTSNSSSPVLPETRLRFYLVVSARFALAPRQSLYYLSLGRRWLLMDLIKMP